MKGPEIPSILRTGVPAFRMFKTAKAKQFRYQPRYFDPVEEEREKRFKELDREIAAENAPPAERARISFRENGAFDRQRDYHQKLRKSNLRLLIILFLLAGIAIYLMDYLELLGIE